jgi:hypothetical protein
VPALPCRHALVALGQLPKHGHSNVAVVPRVVRVVDPGVLDERVEAAVTWLEEQWRGEPYVPDDLLPNVTA